jgi:hypothetical protein
MPQYLRTDVAPRSAASVHEGPEVKALGPHLAQLNGLPYRTCSYVPRARRRVQGSAPYGRRLRRPWTRRPARGVLHLSSATPPHVRVARRPTRVQNYASCER